MSRQRELEAIELALAGARTHAESIDDPVVEYFIEMAIVEVRAKLSAEPRDARPQLDSRTLNVVQLRS
jgi:hypothetical protein